ncbi:MAG: shikimate kinase [Actinobacteria bacterium]|nr:MAG: shikimate kinase [Actinomycetota bacterium]
MNIVLIGFMGSGKSTAGKILADLLEYDFIDTDRVIEERAGRSIPQIFEEQGEERFRQLESLVLESVCAGSRRVISTGGGAVLRQRNFQCLKQSGRVVYLHLSEDELLKRTARLSGRPLLAGADRKERVRELLAERSGLYEKAADLTIEADRLEPKQVAETIAERLGRN